MNIRGHLQSYRMLVQAFFGMCDTTANDSFLFHPRQQVPSFRFSIFTMQNYQNHFDLQSTFCSNYVKKTYQVFGTHKHENRDIDAIP